MTSKSRRKKNAMYLSYADLDHTCRNPTRHACHEIFDPPQCRVSSLCLPIFQALHRKSWDALIHRTQAMKADQACIVIFREKQLSVRYMICLFHVLDQLGSLRLVNKRVNVQCIAIYTDELVGRQVVL